MSKLRSVGKPTPEEQIEREPNHVCRWCHYCVYENGVAKCVKGNLVSLMNTTIMHDLVEEGHISDVVEEALHSCPDGEKEFFKTVVSALPKLSIRGRKEFREAFNLALEQYLDVTIKEAVVESVETLLSNYESDRDPRDIGVQIFDPSTHYCRDFR